MPTVSGSKTAYWVASDVAVEVVVPDEVPELSLVPDDDELVMAALPTHWSCVALAVAPAASVTVRLNL